MSNEQALVVSSKLQAKIKENILKTMGDFIDDVAVESIVNEVYNEEMAKVKADVRKEIAKVFAESLSEIIRDEWQKSTEYGELQHTFRQYVISVLKEVGFDSVGLMLHKASVDTINQVLYSVENAINNSSIGINVNIMKLNNY